MDDSDFGSRHVENDQIFVVGIGSSAGGLEAIRDLVSQIALNVEAAYVIVQHMAPQHKSLLTTLIGRETQLEVADIEDGIIAAPQRIYVTPPNQDVIFEEGRLFLRDPNPEIGMPKPSIDRFLISLAESVGPRAVGIVLSGTGSDGAYGIQAVRGGGGITVAQDVKSAKYDGMPTAAVETGCVDLVLSPTQIGTHLSKILSADHDFTAFRTLGNADAPHSDLLQILLARTRVDFREYKPSTVQRRIERRMNALNILDQGEYTTHCRTNQKEVDALFRDLLISVTRFFRDPVEFRALKTVIEQLVSAENEEPVRVWVPGCATGEEVYSVAMVLAMALGGPGRLAERGVQIFATDIDEAALQVARAGWYSLSALNDIPSEYSEQFFVRKGEGIHVVSELRDAILFSKHNVAQDPPFLNIDLLCCRNLLIYFNNALQSRVLTRFHYALNPSGLLFLGTAESTSGSGDLFLPAAKDGKFFRKRTLPRSNQPYSRRLMNMPQGVTNHRANAIAHKADVAEVEFFETLVRSLSPNAVLVSNDLRIVRVFGDLTPFVKLTEGDRLMMSLAMLRQPLANEARTLVTLALKHNERRVGRVQEIDDAADTYVVMEALPVRSQPTEDSLVLLTFTERKKEAQILQGETGGTALKSVDSAAYIEKLEYEVSSTREALQQTVEQLETSNEELQSLNEELQSTNEELQATNEELETSNEELQSTNEELVTVNEELQVNTVEISMVTDELEAVLQNIGVPVLVVDTALQVSRASLEAQRLFSIAVPLARPHLSQISVPRGFPNLPDICNDCLQLGKTTTARIEMEDGDYALYCSPFSDPQGRIQGASMIFGVV